MTKNKALVKKSQNPRNKDGKTNEGVPYRYPKAVKSKSLKSSAVDLSVLNANELKLLNILKKNGYGCIKDLQQAIFSAKSFELYGTSDTRNLLRRIGSNSTGSKLIEPCPGERGYYRLTAKGEKHLAAFKKSGKKAKAAPKKAKKPAAKKAAPKKKPAAKKKAPAKAKAKKPAAKKAATKKAA